MTKIFKYIDFAEKKFELGLLLFIFLKTFFIMGNVSKDPAIFSLLDGTSNLLLVVLLLIKKWTKIEVWILGIMIPLLVFTYYTSKDGVLLWSFLVIMLAIDISKEKIMTSFLIASFSKNMMTFILSFFGIYTPFTQVKPGSGIVRYSFGFAHANTLHLFCFAMLVAYVVIRKEKIMKLEYIFLSLLNLILFYFTVSRTATILIMLLLLVSYVLFHKPIKSEKTINGLMKWSSILVLMMAFTIMIVSFTYHLTSNGIIEKLNLLLSRRIEQANWYFTENGLSLAGQYIPQIFVRESLSFVLDNGYMRVLIQFGVLPFLILMSSLIFTIRKLYLDQRYSELAVVTISLLIFVLENYLGFIFINISLIFISIIFESNREGKYSFIRLPFEHSKIKELFTI